MHCSDAPCMAVCPVDCFYHTDEGVVLHDKDLCIGCGYCFYACPFGAPQFPANGTFGLRGKMDKCTFCAGGPEANGSEAEFKKYGRNRLAEGKLPACAEMCSTKALLGGDGDVVADIFRNRVLDARQGQRSLGLGHRLRQAGAGQGRRGARGQEVMSVRRARSVGVGLGLVAVALVLAACGERVQTTTVGTERKPTPTAGTRTARYLAPGWKPGDKASWEAQMRVRAQNQNDYPTPK